MKKIVGLQFAGLKISAIMSSCIYVKMSGASFKLGRTFKKLCPLAIYTFDRFGTKLCVNSSTEHDSNLCT